MTKTGVQLAASGEINNKVGVDNCFWVTVSVTRPDNTVATSERYPVIIEKYEQPDFVGWKVKEIVSIAITPELEGVYPYYLLYYHDMSMHDFAVVYGDEPISRGSITSAYQLKAGDTLNLNISFGMTC